MIKNLKRKFIRFLQRWVTKLDREFLEDQHKHRIEFIKQFFYEILPEIDDKWNGKAIIEGGVFNYFELPSGKLPYYDFVLPEVPLYVLVPNIMSADWEQVYSKGISRESWEQYQRDLSFTLESTKGLSSINMATKPHILIINWNEPLNHFTLAEKLKEIINE